MDDEQIRRIVEGLLTVYNSLDYNDIEGRIKFLDTYLPGVGKDNLGYVIPNKEAAWKGLRFPNKNYGSGYIKMQ